MSIYNLAWGVVTLPLLGLLASFLAETHRRAAQICFVFTAGTAVMAAIVLGVRVTHTPAPEFNNVITFFVMNPPESSVFASRFEPFLGVHVDPMSASFGAAVSFIACAVQGYALTALRGEAGYRPFFLASSLLAFAGAGFVYSPDLFQSLLMWSLGSAAVYLLLLHGWRESDQATPARRSLVILTAGNLALLLALVFVFIKLGPYTATHLSAPAGQDIADPFAFNSVALGA